MLIDKDDTYPLQTYETIERCTKQWMDMFGPTVAGRSTDQQRFDEEVVLPKICWESYLAHVAVSGGKIVLGQE